MLDYALEILNTGKLIACDKISGVNDNMDTNHYHDFYEFYYLEKGERYVFIKDKVHLVTPGQLVFVEPYTLHRSYGDDDVGFTRILIYFNKQGISNMKLLESLSLASGVYAFDVKTVTFISNTLYTLLNNQSQDPLFANEYSLYALHLLLITLIRHADALKPSLLDNKMSTILRYINAHYKEPLSLSLLSEMFFISPYHLCREFKRHTDSTLVQYINHTRILNAQRLLYTPSLSVISIATQVGFENVTHFNRTFKKITGVTPSQFRKSIPQ